MKRVTQHPQSGPGGGKPGRARRHRGPQFRHTPAAVIDHFWTEGNCAMCAGEVLALMELMLCWDWNTSELAAYSKVPRTTLTAILNLEVRGCTDTYHALAETCGLRLPAFYLLADFCLESEVTPWRHLPRRQAVGNSAHAPVCPFCRQPVTSVRFGPGRG